MKNNTTFGGPSIVTFSVIRVVDRTGNRPKLKCTEIAGGLNGIGNKIAGIHTKAAVDL